MPDIRIGYEYDSSGAAQMIRDGKQVGTTTRETARQMDRLENETRQAGKAMAATAAASTRLQGGVSRTSGAFRRFGPQIQNTSFQLQDIIVQMQMGVGASRALGTQLPQLLGGFGPLGAVMGVVAGATASLIPLFFNMGEEAKTGADKVNDLNSAVEGLGSLDLTSITDIKSNFDRLTEAAQQTEIAIRRAQVATAEMARDASIRELGDQVDAFLDRNEQLIFDLTGGIRGVIEFNRYFQSTARTIQVFGRDSEEAQAKLNQLITLLAESGNESAVRFSAELGSMVRSIQNAEDQADAARSILDVLNGVIDANTVATNDAAGGVDTYTDALKRLEEQVSRNQRRAIFEAGGSGSLVTGVASPDTAAFFMAHDMRMKRLEEEREAQLKADKEAAAERLKIEEELAKDRERVIERYAGRVEKLLADRLYDHLKGEHFDYLEFFKDTFLRTVADVAAAVARQAIIVPVVSQFVGGGGVPGMGGGGGGLFGGGNMPSIPGLSNLTGGIDRFGASIGFGASNPAALGTMTNAGTMVGPGMPGAIAPSSGFTSASLSSVLGAGGIGALGGGLLASITGGNQMGGTFGGGAGSAIGMAVGGPIGAVAGGLLGGIGGGLFGGDGGVGPIGHTDIMIRGGRYVVGNSPTDNGGDPTGSIQQATQFVNTVNAFAEQQGLRVRGGMRYMSFGNAPHPQSAQAMLADLLANPSQSLTGARGLAGNVLRNARGLGLDRLGQEMNFARVFDDLINGAAQAEEALSPMQRELRELGAVFDRARDSSDLLGLSIKQINREEDKLRRKIRERYTMEARLSVGQQSLGAVQQIEEFLFGQAVSGDSARNPLQRIDLAEERFARLSREVRGGDLSRLGDLTQTGQTLLNLGRASFASTDRFVEIEQSVRGELQRVAERIGSNQFINREAADLIRDQTRQQADDADDIKRELRALRRDLRQSLQRVNA